RAPPCGSARLPTSPLTGRGSRARGWPHAKRGRGRGGYPRPPDLTEPCGRRYVALGLRRFFLSLRCLEPSCLSGLSMAAIRPVATRIACRRLRLGMSEKGLDITKVGPLLEQFCREGMSQGMEANSLRDACGCLRFMEEAAQLAISQMLTLATARE